MVEPRNAPTPPSKLTAPIPTPKPVSPIASNPLLGAAESVIRFWLSAARADNIATAPSLPYLSVSCTGFISRKSFSASVAEAEP